MKERIVFWDLIKGIAIFLVILGHSNISGFLYRFIFSFHMPLFMLVSGYFFAFSVKKKTGYILKTTLRQTLLWIFICGTLFFFIEYFNHETSFRENLIQYYGVIIRTLWFLWAILFSRLAFLILERICPSDNVRLWISVLMAISFLFIPDFACQAGSKFMFPCFITGIYMNRFKAIEYYKAHSVPLAIGIVFLFIILLSFFKEDYTFYSCGVYIFSGIHSPLMMVYINSFRYIIGIIGSLSIMIIIYEMMRFFHYRPVEDFLSLFGRNTLGIYIVHIYLNYYIYKLHPAGQVSFMFSLIYTTSNLVLFYVILRVKHCRTHLIKREHE